MFLVKNYFKTEFFEGFGCPAPANSVMWKCVKQFSHIGNANMSAVGTMTRTAEVSAKLVQQAGMSCRAAKTLQFFPYKVHGVQQL
jgi:hypothetical protein